MKRLILILLVALLLTGCAEESVYVPTGNGMADIVTTSIGAEETPQQPQSLSLAYDPDKTLNPYSCSGYTNRLLFSLLYQSLFTVDSDYQVEPQLCSRYSLSQDMKTYIFYPEEDATFSSGRVLTAADVVASLEAARQSTVYKGRLTQVESITATADGGVQVRLSTAYENFPLLLDIPIVPAEQVDAAYPDGTGPYALVNVGTGLQLWLQEDWWCSAQISLNADIIPLVEAQTASDIRDVYERGNVGVVCTNPASDTYVDFRSNYELWECENGVFVYLGCRAKSSVFSNENVRQALTHAIDRTTLVHEYYRTFGTAATLPASPNSPYYNKSLAAQYGFDAEKFRSVLKQEGLAGSKIVLLVNQDDGRRVKVAQAIAQMLTDCSLEVTVSALSGTAYTKALDQGSYDLHLGQTMLSANMDLSAFFDKTGALNFCGMEDSAIASLCKDALANSGNYDTLHKAVMTDGMLCPVAFLSYAVYAHPDLLEDLSPARDNIFYYSLGKTMSDALITE